MWVIIPAILALLIGGGFALTHYLDNRVPSGWRTLGNTRQGMDVFCNDLDAISSLSMYDVENHIGIAGGWWVGKHPDKASAISAKLRGARLYVCVQDRPLGKARAHVSNGDIYVWWPTESAEDLFLKGHEGRPVSALFLDLVRHEITHLCQYALGRSAGPNGDTHHALAREEGCADGL